MMFRSRHAARSVLALVAAAALSVSILAVGCGSEGVTEGNEGGAVPDGGEKPSPAPNDANADTSLHDGGSTLRDAISDAAHDSDAAPKLCGPATANPGGALDPACVYLLGTLSPGTVGSNVLVHPRHPTEMLAGFYSPHFAGIQSNGQLLFVDSMADQVQRGFSFVQDPYVAGGTYPSLPLANDVQLSLPGCTSQGRTVYRIVTIPGSTDVLYDCGHAYGTYYRNGTTPWFAIDEDYIVGVDPAGTAMVTGQSGHRIVSNVASIPVTGVAGVPGQARLAAARWVNSGWIVAAFSNAQAGTRAAALYTVAATGAATEIADYVFDATTDELFLLGSCVLDPTGSLWCMGDRFSAPIDKDDVVVRLPPGKAPVREYDEALGSVKIHGSQLFTGP